MIRGPGKPPARRLRAILFAVAALALIGCGASSEEKKREAIALVEAEKFEEAIPLLEICLKKEPADLDLRASFALALTRAGRANEAIEQWLPLIERNPNWSEGRYWLGIAYVTVDKVDEAVKQWVKVIEIDSTHINAHYNLGFAYTKMALFPLSVEEWSQVLRLDPTHFEARINRGRVRVAQGDLRGGLEDFLVCLAVKPEEALNWIHLGETYFLMDDSAKAVAAIDSFLAKQVGREDLTAKARRLREDIVAGVDPPDVQYRPFIFFSGGKAAAAYDAQFADSGATVAAPGSAPASGGPDKAP